MCYFFRTLLLVLHLGITTTINSFNHTYYITQHPLPYTNDFGASLNHFACTGQKQGLPSAATRAPNTNFDWEYYVQHNKLTDIHSEADAYEHYITKGKLEKLDYCKKFDILIALHLYDLDLTDEIIGRINYFIHNNPCNNYRIKINIPISDRLDSLGDFSSGYQDMDNQEAITFVKNRMTTLRSISNHDPIAYEPYARTLHRLAHYVSTSLSLPQENIHIIFSENRGMDIGGFLVLLHEMKKDTTPFDFLVKLHTKKEPSEYGDQFGQTWKSCLMSFLNSKINIVLRTYNAIYPCMLNWRNDSERNNPLFMNKKTKLCNILNISVANDYNFSAGTMFVVPHVFVTTLQQWNLEQIYSLFELGRVIAGYEHVCERLFGYIGETLCTKIACFDSVPRGCYSRHSDAP